eukprot:44203_1
MDAETETQYAPMDISTANAVRKDNIRRRVSVAFLLGFLLSTLLYGIGVTIYVQSENSNKINCPSNYVATSTTTCSDEHKNAINEIHSILSNSTLISSTMSENDKVKAENAYNTFDENNDGLLSYNEYLSYEQCLSNHSTSFNIIDYDNDGIISNRELVSYLMNIQGTSKDIMTITLDNHINNIYGFDEGINANNTQIRSQQYHEYIADIWFQMYDKERKGYINFTDWQYTRYNQSFISFDSNNDNMISFDEFLEGQFHLSKTNNASRAFKLFSSTITSSDVNVQNNLHYVGDYGYDDIKELNLTVCHNNHIDIRTNPAVIDTKINRRRLFWDCVWDAAECGYDVVDAGTECTAGEVLTDGIDTLICAGSIVEVCHSCYEMYTSC